MKLLREELKSLMKTKMMKAGLPEDQSEIVSEILTWSDERGYHSHGAVRVEYYSERIAKGGWTLNPNFKYEITGPCSAIFDGDNASGYVAVKYATEKAINMARENGVAVVGVKNIAHSGALGYYTEMVADQDMIAITFCQSDPRVVPYGGTEPYYGTNPISFAVPTSDERKVVFDMATTVQAWGKILDKRSRHERIPDTWAVDKNGVPVTDPHKVNALVPIAGAKGYGLMMMVDIFAGVLLGVPFGRYVSSMYYDLSKGRGLGQLIIVINPEKFIGITAFKKAMSQICDELGEMPAAPGFDKVYYPGERAEIRKEKQMATGGIDIADDIYEYLISDKVHTYSKSYDHKNRFAD